MKTESIPWVSWEVSAKEVEAFSDSGLFKVQVEGIHGAVKVRLIHGALGMTTELGELMEHKDRVNFMEEIGDLMWYWAITVDALGLDPLRLQKEGRFYNPKGDENPLSFLTLVVVNWVDEVKKHVFYDKPLSGESVYLSSILFYLEEMVTSRGCWRFGDVLQRNIEKLAVRYKSAGFSGTWP